MDTVLWLPEHYLLLEEDCALLGFEACQSSVPSAYAWVRLCEVYTHVVNVKGLSLLSVVLFTSNAQQLQATQIPLWDAQSSSNKVVHICLGQNLNLKFS